jgi:hypothetical protein
MCVAQRAWPGGGCLEGCQRSWPPRCAGHQARAAAAAAIRVRGAAAVLPLQAAQQRAADQLGKVLAGGVDAAAGACVPASACSGLAVAGRCTAAWCPVLPGHRPDSVLRGTLQWSEEHRDDSSTTILYERCLVPCANCPGVCLPAPRRGGVDTRQARATQPQQLVGLAFVPPASPEHGSPSLRCPAGVGCAWPAEFWQRYVRFLAGRVRDPEAAAGALLRAGERAAASLYGSLGAASSCGGRGAGGSRCMGCWGPNSSMEGWRWQNGMPAASCCSASATPPCCRSLPPACLPCRERVPPARPLHAAVRCRPPASPAESVFCKRDPSTLLFAAHQHELRGDLAGARERYHALLTRLAPGWLEVGWPGRLGCRHAAPGSLHGRGRALCARGGGSRGHLHPPRTLPLGRLLPHTPRRPGAGPPASRQRRCF